MEQLVLQIVQGRIEGSGRDIIAPFAFRGELRDDGSVRMIKQYHRRHAVLYVGNYDGEGTLYGTWDIGGYQGSWLIRFEQHLDGDQQIEEFRPLDPS